MRQRCSLLELRALGLFFNDVKLTEKDAKDVFKRMRSRTAGGGGAEVQADAPYYHRVQALHVGVGVDAPSEIGREAMGSLSELLTHPDCGLRSLDVSNTKVDCWELVQSLRANTSLTSLDVRGVPRMGDLYETLAGVLQMPGTSCRLGYMRCDGFELLEGEKSLSLREKPLEAGAVCLLAGLLRFNRTLQDIDLCACEIEKSGASALAACLEFNTSLTALKLSWNPLMDEESKRAIKEAAANWRPALSLTMS